MELGIELQQRQQLVITPQLQQALRLLQLPTDEFAHEIERAVASNPLLEKVPDAPATRMTPAGPGLSSLNDGEIDADIAMPSGVPAEASTESAMEPMALEAASNDAPLDATADSGSRAQDWNGDGDAGWNDLPHTGGSRGDGDNDWTEWSEAPVSLHENLRQQLRLWPLGERDRALTDMLIDELSDAGYLETPLEELAELMRDDGVDVHELEAALKIVQQLDPPGIGARSLQECLLLQLAELPASTPGLPLAYEIVRDHFDALAKRQFLKLQQTVGCDEHALHTARTVIRTLNPRPGQRFVTGRDTNYIVPDVIVSQMRGRWVASMNPAAHPQIRINRAYADIALHNDGCAASFNQLLKEARWLMRSVEQRFRTIQRVVDAIVAYQNVFFTYGEAAMRPLALKDIADELGLHESTVCRVTNGKYMATPRGLFELKYFFSRHLHTEDGGTCSTLAIRALLKELIAAENPLHPLSDVQLAKLLSQQGFQLARRTVTKYRTSLRIPSVELRRVANQNAARM